MKQIIIFYKQQNRWSGDQSSICTHRESYLMRMDRNADCQMDRWGCSERQTPSILQRRAYVSCRRYVGTSLSAEIVSETRWHRGIISVLDSIFICQDGFFICPDVVKSLDRFLKFLRLLRVLKVLKVLIITEPLHNQFSSMVCSPFYCDRTFA